MLCLLYYICFEQLGYESSDYKPLGLECEGSEPIWCMMRNLPIGFGTECEGSEPNWCTMRNLHQLGSEPSHSKPIHSEPNDL